MKASAPCAICGKDIDLAVTSARPDSSGTTATMHIDLDALRVHLDACLSDLPAHAPGCDCPSRPPRPFPTKESA